MLNLFAFLVLGAGIAFLLSLASARWRRTAFMDREPLSVNELFARYFAGSGLPEEAITRNWTLCAEKLGVPAQVLRPTDRFDRELKSRGMLDAFDGRKDDLARHVLSAVSDKAQLNLSSVATIGELVLMLAKHEGDKTGSWQ